MGNNMEKFVMLTIFALFPMVSSAAITAPVDSAQLLMACAAGSALSALFTFKVSRKVNEADAIINVLIALIGGMSFGYFGANGILMMDVGWLAFAKAYIPFTGLVLALSGSQFIEWIMGGGLVRIIKRRVGDDDNG